MAYPRRIYVAATGQNRGKTTVSLGLIDTMLKSGLRVGFIKPIGQRFVDIDGQRIDEDAVLVDRIFHPGAQLQDMSPVAIARGFTREYIQGKTSSRGELLDKIHAALERVEANADVVVVEGTGHAGVGAVFDLSNPAVAAELGLKAVIVSGGGIGKPIDEILLNRALFREYGVDIVGAIINKVDLTHYDDLKSIVRAGLARQGMDVLGLIPFVPMLSYISMQLIVESIEGTLIAGEEHLDLLIKNIVVGAMTPHRALDYIRERTLVIVPGDRDDILLAVLSSAATEPEKAYVSGLVLTAGIMPHPSIMRLISELQIPTYVVQVDTYRAAFQVHDLLVKIRPSDTTKIAEIFRLVSAHVDVDALLSRIERLAA